MDTLVIGYGSIGSRHARILLELGQNVTVVSLHATADAIFPFKFFSTLESALNRQYDYVVVANKTNEHFSTLSELLQRGHAGTILVEKPLFDKMVPLPSPYSSEIFVAYNLRFHPLMQRLRGLLNGQKLISAQARVGQHLPDWRPGRDYRTHYSARRQEGGGVLTDLSHELDYMSWLLGDWQNLTALGGKWSELEIDSDDVFSLLWSTSRCPVVSLEINYLDRVLRRELTVNTADFTVKADFAANRLCVNSAQEEFSCGRDDTYRTQHAALLSSDRTTACTFTEGMNVMTMIEAAQTAAMENRWVQSSPDSPGGKEL